MSTGELIVYVVVGLIVCILLLAATWKILAKAGEAGWKAIIPFYNMYMLVKIADGNGIKFLLLCIPIVGFIFDIIFSLRLAKAFGKGTGFGVGLFLLPNIFTLILGFGSAEYIGPQGQKKEN
ncbi:MAG: hypothetical protein IKE65_00030 [Clostridia bacterium]|nr:hypothetical protein [Clostridia bacterium]